MKTLRTYGLSLRRRHGQNFLINRELAERILEHAEVNTEDTVLEIGPGLGQLTFLLAERVKRVIAVEIDGGVVRYLRDAVGELGVENVTIVNGDFLDGNFQAAGMTKVVSNFPYNIAIKAIIKVLKEMKGVAGITGTVQREIAERVTATPGTKDYSAVSVIMQFLARLRVLEKRIDPRNFFPVPGVTSAVISVVPRGGKAPVDGEIFERVVRAGFESRRKTLVGNLLAAGILFDAGMVARKFNDSKVRAEKLSMDDFVDIAKIIGGEHEERG